MALQGTVAAQPAWLQICGRKLELEIEALCSLPFLHTPDDLEIQTTLLTFPGAREATQNWVKATVRFARGKSYVLLLPSILSVCPGSRLTVFQLPFPGIPYLQLDFILYFSRRRPRGGWQPEQETGKVQAVRSQRQTTHVQTYTGPHLVTANTWTRS